MFKEKWIRYEKKKKHIATQVIFKLIKCVNKVLMKIKANKEAEDGVKDYKVS
jgi:hypothetical protein